VVFAAAGGSGSGLFDVVVAESEAAGRHIWAIGVDNDQWFDVESDQQGHILTSVIKRGDVAAYRLVEHMLDDEATSATPRLGLSDDAFGYSLQGEGLTPAMIDVLDIGAPLDAGSYEVTALVTPLTVSLEAGWISPLNIGGHTVFTSPTAPLADVSPSCGLTFWRTLISGQHPGQSTTSKDGSTRLSTASSPILRPLTAVSRRRLTPSPSATPTPPRAIRRLRPLRLTRPVAGLVGQQDVFVESVAPLAERLRELLNDLPDSGLYREATELIAGHRPTTDARR